MIKFERVRMKTAISSAFRNSAEKGGSCREEKKVGSAQKGAAPLKRKIDLVPDASQSSGCNAEEMRRQLEAG